MDQYISLADAWARFCELEGVAGTINPMRARPKGVVVRDLIEDPDTFEKVSKPTDGPDYAPGLIDRHRLDYFASKFRDKIALPLKGVTYLLRDDGSREPATPAHWWKEIEPHLFVQYIERADDLADGHARSWDAVKIGTAFPMAVCFSRAAFESEIKAAVGAIDLKTVALRVYASGILDGVKAWKAARENYGIICTRIEWLEAWKATPGAGKQGPKGPRKNYPKSSG